MSERGILSFLLLVAALLATSFASTVDAAESRPGSTNEETAAAVFAADDGELLSQHRIFQPGDSAALPGGDFSLSLTNVPHPARKGSFVGRGSFGDEVPRLVVYDDDGDVAAKALIESEETTANDAVARTLRVAWGGGRVWAGELGSYQTFSFDRDLDLHDEIRDSELAYVSEAEMMAAASRNESVESQAAAGEESDEEVDPEHYDERTGRDLAGASAPPPPPVRRTISVEPVMTDMDWGAEPRRLYVLLDREALEQGLVRELVGGFSAGPGASVSRPCQSKKSSTMSRRSTIGTHSSFTIALTATCAYFRICVANFEPPALKVEPSGFVESDVGA